MLYIFMDNIDVVWRTLSETSRHHITFLGLVFIYKDTVIEWHIRTCSVNLRDPKSKEKTWTRISIDVKDISETFYFFSCIYFDIHDSCNENNSI